MCDGESFAWKTLSSSFKGKRSAGSFLNGETNNLKSEWKPRAQSHWADPQGSVSLNKATSTQRSWIFGVIKLSLFLLLHYTLNKQSQRISVPACGYSQRAGILDLDLQMCDDDGIDVFVTSTFPAMLWKALSDFALSNLPWFLLTWLSAVG